LTTEAGHLDCGQLAGDVVATARDLIGRTLSVRSGAGELRAIILESEAYGGPDDPASHAAFKPGGRAAQMWGQPGTIYVYAAYGMYPCLNIVSGAEGTPCAVLLRGAWIEGQARPVFGPGRLTRALGITMEDHGETICGERFSISASRAPLVIEQTARIGISRGTELPWRFVADTRLMDRP
jgi:DNA-3-methyladenine glycosylase